MFSTFIDLLFPKHCVGCNRVGNYFCTQCIQKITQSDLVCAQCERFSLAGLTHPACKRKYGLDGLWSLGVYQAPLKEAIKKLKYRRIEEYSDVLAGILVEYWARYNPILLDQIKKDKGKGWSFVPVPLYKRRQNWRGFNQSELLARSLTKKIGIPTVLALERVKNTTPQAHLLASERRQNIKKAFALNTQYKILNTNVILLDDVWTTGATLKECGYELKKAGVKKVWALTIAR